MIKADNGNFECKGTRGQLLIDFAQVYDEFLKEEPEMVLAVSTARADEFEKAYHTADFELVVALIDAISKIYFGGETK